MGWPQGSGEEEEEGGGYCRWPGQVAVERGVWSPRLIYWGWRAEAKWNDFTEADAGRGQHSRLLSPLWTGEDGRCLNTALKGVGYIKTFKYTTILQYT